LHGSEESVILQLSVPPSVARDGYKSPPCINPVSQRVGASLNKFRENRALVFYSGIAIFLIVTILH